MPHLLAWVPGQLLAGYWLFWRSEELNTELRVFAASYFVIIGISNAFDLYDSWRWLRGERAILGA